MLSQGRDQRTMKVSNNNWFCLLPVHTCVAESTEMKAECATGGILFWACTMYRRCSLCALYLLKKNIKKKSETRMSASVLKQDRSTRKVQMNTTYQVFSCPY